jgi:S1-C subfamily serine protease
MVANTAIVAPAQGSGSPPHRGQVAVDQLADKGKVVRGWIGLSLEPFFC